MFFDGNIFWLLNGILFVLVAAGFKAFADDKGWVITWLKGVLAVVWYILFSLSFYTWGTLVGEQFPTAGFRLFLVGFFVSLVLGIGLWRWMAMNPKTEA